jgi:hypothetical protein
MQAVLIAGGGIAEVIWQPGWNIRWIVPVRLASRWSIAVRLASENGNETWTLYHARQNRVRPERVRYRG